MCVREELSLRSSDTNRQSALLAGVSDARSTTASGADCQAISNTGNIQGVFDSAGMGWVAQAGE